MTLNRREWLLASGVSAAGLALPTSLLAADSGMKLSLAAYSFRQWLDLKKKEMTLIDFIDLSATYPLDAVELTAYYFEKTTPEYLKAVKDRCIHHKLEVSGTAVGNNFCVSEPAKLKEQIEMVKNWVDHTKVLGGKAIRIFAGSIKKGDDEAAMVKQAVRCMEEVCEYAGKNGIKLALENHGGITSTPEQLLGLVKAVKSDALGINLDSGNFHTEDPYGDLAKIAPLAVNVQFKTEISPKGKPKEEADLAKLVDMMKKVNYRGYIALEYEAAEDAKVAVPRYLKSLRKLLS